jgi:HAE1 family hydrophobic/amphiphilic exporter-1
LGSVVLGGLSLSAVLTLAIIPPLMALFCAAIERGRDERIAAKAADTEADGAPLKAIEDKSDGSGLNKAPTPKPNAEPTPAE